MSIFRFVTPDIFSKLDEDDEANFVTLLQAARNGLDTLSANHTDESEASFYTLLDINYDFLNAVVAIARESEVQPFASVAVPAHEEFRKDFDFRNFKAQLDFYLAQSALRRAKRAAQSSVAMPLAVKDQIRKYVHGLRECVEKSEMDAAKRELLLKRLDDFERELEKRRVSLITLTLVLLELAAIPGGVDSAYQLIERLRSNILREVAAAKSKEDEARGYLHETRQRPLLIEAPTSHDHRAVRFGKSSSQTSPIDDDIPF